MNATLAARLGRPDLIGVPIDPYGGTSGNPQAPSMAIGGNISAGLEGRLTAGIMALMLVGVIGFYIWTREHQA